MTSTRPSHGSIKAPGPRARQTAQRLDAEQEQQRRVEVLLRREVERGTLRTGEIRWREQTNARSLVTTASVHRAMLDCHTVSVRRFKAELQAGKPLIDRVDAQPSYRTESAKPVRNLRFISAGHVTERYNSKAEQAILAVVLGTLQDQLENGRPTLTLDVRLTRDLSDETGKTYGKRLALRTGTRWEHLEITSQFRSPGETTWSTHTCLHLPLGLMTDTLQAINTDIYATGTVAPSERQETLFTDVRDLLKEAAGRQHNTKTGVPFHAAVALGTGTTLTSDEFGQLHHHTSGNEFFL